MLIKRALLATSALAVIAGIGPAQAAGPLYVSVFGGANFQQQNSSHVSNNVASTDVRLDPDTGFLIGAEVGVHLDRVAPWSARRAWRHPTGATMSTALGFRVRSSTSQRVRAAPSTRAVSTFAVMANVWYDIDLGYKWRPYVGGGAGWARTHVQAVAVTAFTGGGELGTAAAVRPFTTARALPGSSAPASITRFKMASVLVWVTASSADRASGTISLSARTTHRSISKTRTTRS
jgi:opacity protein-like surface antigen